MSRAVAPDAAAQPASRVLRRRRTRRFAALSTGAVVLVAAAVTAGLGLGLGGETQTPAPRRTGPAATVQVDRETLIEDASVAGMLDYGSPVPLASAATGTVTWLPAVGSVVRRGSPALRADEKPVLLMYGELPMYRALTVDAQGADVRQLERNLSALGYGGFTVDDTFSAATAAAVKRWQLDLGLAGTGTVERERVIFVAGPIRVASRLVRLGATATGDVLSYTGNTRVVTVAANATAVSWATKGTKVTVTLPGGKSTTGTVTAVAAEVQAPPEGGDDSPEAPGTDGATINVTIAVPDRKALGKLTSAPVDVSYVTEKREDVLTVPVPALLALAEGGYGLEVIEPTGSRIVGVQAGLFAGGRVEVSGDGLDAGMTVGVPE